LHILPEEEETFLKQYSLTKHAVGKVFMQKSSAVNNEAVKRMHFTFHFPYKEFSR
jgi:hypothetical protein